MAAASSRAMLVMTVMVRLLMMLTLMSVSVLEMHWLKGVQMRRRVTMIRPQMWMTARAFSSATPAMTVTPALEVTLLEMIVYAQG